MANILSTRRPALPLFLLFVVAATAVAYAPRVDHYREWDADRESHFAGEVVASGTDSYYWFRVARELRDGTWDPESLDPLRDYPDGRLRGSAPWIARTIAGIADALDVDVYRAGLWFTLVTSCLFVIPMSLYGWYIRWPAAGLLGGLISAASVAFFSRASIHRVDTDGANLFGLWWIALLFALPSPKIGVRCQLGLAALAGISVALFVGWYDRAGFWLILAISFFACLVVRGFAVKRIWVIGLVFLVCANPFQLMDSLGAIGDYVADYLAPTLTGGGASSTSQSPLEYSSISSRIEEMNPFPFGQSMSRILEPVWLPTVGLLVFCIWAFREWRSAAPLAPLTALGLLGLLSAKRFVMYLAPLAGFGLGIALTFGARRVVKRIRFAAHADTLACLLVFAAFALLASGSFYANRPTASNPAHLLASLRRAKAELPAGSVVWHSWGAGYLLQDVLGAATFNDGERPNPVIDHLLVKGLTSDDPRELQRVVAHLMTHSRTEVTESFRSDYAKATADMLSGSGEFSGDAFLLFTTRSPLEFPSYYLRGQWDFETRSGRTESIHKLRCKRARPRRFQCRDAAGGDVELDLSKGMIGRTVPLKQAVITRDYVEQSTLEFPHPNGDIVQLYFKSGSGAVAAFFMSPEVFASNLNQLYMLDRVDERYFERVFDDRFVARLYRVKGAPLDAR